MADVREAARRLAAGELVAFATETVYGLGADATNPAAVAKVFALKGRPPDHPLIVHVADAAAIDRFAVTIPPAARELARQFWPGPLTMILRKSRAVPREVTGGQDTVGLRCPSHPVAHALLAEFAQVGSGAIAAPSANRFGHVSPTTAQHVRDEFGDAVPILDGGESDVGLESTIVDLSRGAPVLLRPGGVAREDIEAALGTTLALRDAGAPRASGTLDAHYAPRTPLAIVEAAGLAHRVGPDVAVMASGPGSGARLWIDAPADPLRYGHALYANLRKLDASGARLIVVERPPATPAWEAINDRLARAAAGAIPDDKP